MKRIQISLILALVLCVSAFAQEKKPIQFEHIFDSSFSPQSVENVRWMKDGRFYTAQVNQQIVRYNILKEEALVLFDGANFKSSDYPKGFQVQGYEFSSDEKKILLKTDVDQIWRRSTREHYYVYDIVTKKLSKLTSSDVRQQLATLSPDGNKAAFVRENNLFWIDLASGKETQITTDGEYNNIINGATDWVKYKKNKRHIVEKISFQNPAALQELIAGWPRGLLKSRLHWPNCRSFVVVSRPQPTGTYTNLLFSGVTAVDL